MLPDRTQPQPSRIGCWRQGSYCFFCSRFFLTRTLEKLVQPIQNLFLDKLSRLLFLFQNFRWRLDPRPFCPPVVEAINPALRQDLEDLGRVAAWEVFSGARRLVRVSGFLEPFEMVGIFLCAKSVANSFGRDMFLFQSPHTTKHSEKQSLCPSFLFNPWWENGDHSAVFLPRSKVHITCPVFPFGWFDHGFFNCSRNLEYHVEVSKLCMNCDHPLPSVLQWLLTQLWLCCPPALPLDAAHMPSKQVIGATRGRVVNYLLKEATGTPALTLHLGQEQGPACVA